MDPSLIIRFILFALLVGLLAFFSSCETALFSLSRSYREKLGEEHSFPSQLIAHLLRDPRRLIITLLLGNELANIGIGITGASLVLRLLGEGADLLAIGASTLILLIVGEILPKSLALRHAQTYARQVALPLEFVARLIFPLRWLMQRLADGLLRALGGTRGEGEEAFNEEEFRAMLAAGEDAGVLHESERAMIQKVLAFSETTVSQVMTPRIDLDAVEVRSTLEVVMASVKEGHFSRMPVYDQTIDTVVGILYAKDLLRWETRAKRIDGESAQPQLNLRELLREPYFVPEGKRVSDLLREFQQKKVHMAIVLDEYGGVAGLVTMEDLLEELVGEISDEFDLPEAVGAPYQQLTENRYRISAKMPMGGVEELLQRPLPPGDYETLAGFVLHLFGRLPRRGEHVASNGLTFTIEKMRGTRILEITVDRHPD
ncbi:MAG: HlyC/CorC family transporter [Candidatus Tectomicrobia bacterium]|nr:HlyC/CorC family transporter [Candidatus Tectomicrobia bacterium]